MEQQQRDKQRVGANQQGAEFDRRVQVAKNRGSDENNR